MDLLTLKKDHHVIGALRGVSLSSIIKKRDLVTNNTGVGKLPLSNIVLKALILAFFCSTESSIAFAQYISLDAIEVTQAVQAMDHSVPLVSAKGTMVRAYFTLKQMNGSVTITSGKLRIQGFSSAAAPTVMSVNAVRPSINTSPVIVTNDPSLKPKRLDPTKTLNFLVGLGPGTYTFWIEDLVVSGGVPCQSCGNGSSSTTIKLQFDESPTLRIHLIPVQYYNFSDAGAPPVYSNRLPDNDDYPHIASWFKRAYPVSQNRLQVTDTRQTPLLIDITKYVPVAYQDYKKIPCGTTNGELEVYRLNIINDETNPDKKAQLGRTHFHGLLDDHDPNGADAYKNGCTSQVPSPQSPLENYFSHPGSSPTGKPPQSFLVGGATWDSDGHYGDWYAGHEIAHALNLPHADSNQPSPPPSTVCTRDIPYPTPLLPYPPYPNGQLYGTEEVYMGFDAGDTSLSISEQILQGSVWHDLMTYCINRWISDVTYRRIWCRLHEENGLTCPGMQNPPPVAPTNLKVTDSRSPDQLRNNQMADPRFVTSEWTVEEFHSQTGRIRDGQPNRQISVQSIPSQPRPLMSYIKPVATQELLQGFSARDEYKPILMNHNPSTSTPARFLKITAGIDLKAKRGVFFSTMIITSLSAEVGTPDPRAQIRLLDASDHEIQSFPVKAPTGAPSLSLEGETEWVTVEVPFPSQTRTVELVVNGKIVDRRVVTIEAPTIQNIRVRTPGTGPIPTGMVIFEWDSNDPDGGERTYIVRLSRDNGQSWTPIITNLTRPVLALPRKQLGKTTAVRLRITASDGFNTTTVTSGTLLLSP